MGQWRAGGSDWRGGAVLLMLVSLEVPVDSSERKDDDEAVTESLALLSCGR